MTITRRDLFLVMLVTILWGLHAPIMKLGVTMLEPLSLNFVRFFLTGLVFLPFAGKISWEDLKKLIPVSVFFVGANLMFAHLALSYISGNSFIVLIMTAQPLTIVLAWLLFGEKFGIYTTAGIAVAFSGLLIIFGAPDIAAAPLGALFALLGALGWSLGSLSMKRTGHIKPATFLSYSYLMAAPIALAGTLLREDHQIERFLEADMATLAFVIFYQVIIMAAMSFTWAGLMARNEAQYVTPFLLLQPIFGIIGGYFINAEILHWNVALGGLTVIAGIAVINWRQIVKRKIKS